MSSSSPADPAPEATPGGRPAFGGRSRRDAAAANPTTEPRLTSHEEALLDRLADLIATSPHNLVSRGERSRVRSVHVEECLQLGELLAPADGSRWMDLGTGGGLPGLVLAVRYSGVHWTLVDSVAKKIAAVRSFSEALDLTNVTVIRRRAEELAWEADHRARYDGVVSRALASLATVMELSRSFLKDRGLLAVVKGPHVVDELPDAERARRLLRLGPVHRATVPDSVRPTVLVTMRAHGSPPHQYPRKVGVPAAAPLGGRTT